MSQLETTVAICGHAQHGKSTLAGRVMMELGGVDRRELERRWSMAPENIRHFDRFRKSFNKFNYVFLERRPATFSPGGDVDDPSRTAYPTRASVSFEGRRLTLVDEPGYSRFIDNIVYGIYMADYGVLAINASKGVEAGAVVVAKLLSFFSMPLLCVCVTKMDEVGFSQSVFSALSEQIRTRILRPFFSDSVAILPSFALSDAALMKDEQALSWHQGPSVTTILKEAMETQRLIDAPGVRFAVREVFSPPGAGTVLVGILESGSIAAGDSLLLEPTSTLSGRNLTLRCRSVRYARAVNEGRRDNVTEIHARAIAAVGTADISRDDAERAARHGALLGAVMDPPSVATRIEAEIVFFSAHTAYSGKQYHCSANTANAPAFISCIRGKRGFVTAGSLDEYSASRGEFVNAEIELGRPICIETDPRFQKLSRFALREENQVVACGRCVRIIERSSLL